MGFNEAMGRVRARIHNRTFCYRAVFLVKTPAPDVRWWHLAFWRAPKGGQLGTAAEFVLEDLRHYCYAGRRTIEVSPVDRHIDPLAMAFAEGRRDVFNRITAMLNLTDDQIDRIAYQRSTE